VRIAASIALLLAAPAAGQDRLEMARRAAFPNGTNLAEGDEIRTFGRSRLVETRFGPVLVSEGHIEMGSHATPGVIAVHYLRPEGTGFALRRAFLRAAENGSHGGMSGWSITRRFTGLAAVYTEGGGTWQGYTCTVATLTELRPDGPAEVALIPIYYDNAGVGGPGHVRHLEGRIANIRRGRSFDVVFTGSTPFTEHYVWRRGRFVRTGGESRASC